MLVITSTLKYPDALGEAQMLQPPQEGTSPRAKDPKTGPQDGGGPADA